MSKTEDRFFKYFPAVDFKLKIVSGFFKTSPFSNFWETPDPPFIKGGRSELCIRLRKFPSGFPDLYAISDLADI